MTTKQQLEKKIAEAELQHYIPGRSRNLGQYKIEATCKCGAVLLEDGHSQDPFVASMTAVLALHRAEEYQRLIDEYCKSQKEDDNASDS